MMKYYKLTNPSGIKHTPMVNFILRFICLILICSTYVLGQNDAKSNELIQKCENAMGGQKAYKAIKHISWNFFGTRTLYWNKHNGDVRIEIPKENKILLWNANTMQGKAIVEEKEVTDHEELKKAMIQAKGIWINDSYWLVMPFKLNDPGVNKKYIGQKETLAGVISDVIEVTFNEVGNTPDNKYHIYFDPTTHLVNQWDFYRKFSDEKASFAMPWQDYKKFGKVMLSGDRGERKLNDINVYKKLPDSVYQSFETVKN
jgi:hypothetical protein